MSAVPLQTTTNLKYLNDELIDKNRPNGTGSNPISPQTKATETKATPTQEDVDYWTIIGQVIFMLVSLYAAFLSFKCNTNVNMFLRILYALVAGIFGFVYLMYYFLFRQDVCGLRKLATK